MKIGILGLRGLPSTYSGYEAVMTELAPRLVQRGHDVTVYCRSGLFKEKPPEWRGVKLRYIPSIEHKVASTLTHSFLSITDASFRSFDVIFVVNAANGMFGFIPRLLGRPSVINVDGMEWLRPKWNSAAKFIFKNSARLGCTFYNEVVTDAEEMQRLYEREFGARTAYIAYGANIADNPPVEGVLNYGLEPRNYYLVLSRMVPDNNADTVVKGFVKSGSNKILALAGGADYRGNERELKFREELKAAANDRVKFLGHIGSPELVQELHAHAYGYIHGHQFGGVNPSLLTALGSGSCVLALNTKFNSEVLNGEQYGMLWKKDPDDLARLINKLDTNPQLAEDYRSRSADRIREKFTWEKITSDYEELFLSLLEKKR